MKYQSGKIGRCILVQLEHDDDVLPELLSIVRKERIKAAVFYLLGGIKEAKIVVGPEKEELPPEPVWRKIDESHEMVGVGTIFWEKDEPRIHFHGAFGKKESVRAGCLREAARAFIVLEAVILEIEGVQARREFDPQIGMTLLKL